MLTRGMYSGVSGLMAEGEALGVAGDNIANVNTTGFKSQRAVFEDMLGRSMRGPGSEATAGAGVRVSEVQQTFTQGALVSTGVATDVALSGEGFFVVRGDVDGIEGNYYTRAGQFALDAQGFLVNPNGLYVQGYAANSDGSFAPSLSSVSAPSAALAPRATEEITVVANLDPEEAVPAAAWNPADPGGTSNFSTSITVYDSLGSAHSVDLYFSRTGANTWDWHATVSGDETEPAVPGSLVDVGGGSLGFSTAGELDSISSNTLSVSFAGATPGQSVELDFGQALASGGTGVDGLTQFAAPSSVSSQSQDGYSSGEFSGVTVDGRGVVLGLYSNGEKVPLAQLAVATFRSNQGLARAGQNLWGETTDSGPPAIGTAGSGGRGTITSGVLEGSNVDMAQEFVGLIEHQRAFSANSKTITTADEMLQVLMNLKR